MCIESILIRDLEEFRVAAAEYTEHACRTRKALMDAGIYDEDGNLTEHYR